MRRTSRFFAALLALSLAVLPVPLAVAQQEEAASPQDAGFLENLIQNALGGDGRTVRVSGLSGLLSSQATINLIEVADDDGTWLRVKDVALDWRRLALLRGRLEVNALTVGVIDVIRKPLPPPNPKPKLAADPDAMPEPFSLPELPVSVNVSQLSVGAIQLRQPVLGQAAQLSLSGSARLAGGEGNANLALVRIDGHESSYRLAASFVNASEALNIDLDVSEAKDGLITTLAGIPDSPPLTLTLKGDDPLSDFTADLALRTDAVDRLIGTIGLKDLPDVTPAERMITADVSGDVADLFLPDYRDFFGREVALVLRARQGEAIGFDVQDLALTTRGLRLTGTADLSPAFLPQTLDLKAHLGTDIGLPVVLPLPGPPILVHDADLAVEYDESAGDTFSLSLDGSGFMRADGYLLDTLNFETKGQLTKAGPTDITAALADLSGALTGFSSTNEAIWDAVGDELTLSGRVDWQKAGPLTVTGFEVAAGDLGVTGDATVTGLETQAVAVQADIKAVAGDLERFAAISGQTLDGAIDTRVTATYDTVSGAFDVTLDGSSQDLVVGTPEADGLLTGKVDLGITAERTADGIKLERLMFKGPRIDLEGQGGIDAAGWPLASSITGRIGDNDGDPVVLPVPGPRMTLQSAQLDLEYDPETSDEFSLALVASQFDRVGEASMERAEIRAQGQLHRTDTTVTGAAANITAGLTGLSAANPDLTAAIEPGAALDTALVWDAAKKTLTMQRLNVTSGDLDLTGDAEIIELMTPQMKISGKIDATTGPLARFAAVSGLALRGSGTAVGTASFTPESGFFDVDMHVDARDVATGIAEADKLISGDTQIVARAKRDEDGLSVDRVEVTSRELSALATGGIVGDVTTIDMTAGLRNVALFAPGFNGPLDIKASARGKDDTWTVEGDLTGPRGSTARFSGDAMRPDGTMALDASGALPLGLVNQFILPRTLDGTANFDLSVNGPPGLDALNGRVSVQGARLAVPTFRVALEDIGLTVALASSRAQIDLAAALSSGGRITVNGPVDLTGPFSADITARLLDLTLVDPTLYQIGLNGEVTVVGPLTGGANIAGTIDVGRSEIKIPTAFGGTFAIPDILHVGEPAASLETRQRAGLVKSPSATPSGGGPVYGLDITINAPREVFVRGRGLDVELGGQIQIAGTTASPVPTGGLQMIRGRLDLLSERLTFDSAEISLQGNLDPDINMVASSSNGGVKSQIVIEGPVSAPEFRFSSEPPLPQDEVLAQLFFGKAVRDLTPLEVAQLASAINRLQGGGGGVFGFARNALGVDDLSVGTDDDGNTAVTAGRYINERVYTDVTVGSDGTSEVQLNYEINQDFSVRGRFNNEGETGIGFVFERDY